MLFSRLLRPIYGSSPRLGLIQRPWRLTLCPATILRAIGVGYCCQTPRRSRCPVLAVSDRASDEHIAQPHRNWVQSALSVASSARLPSGSGFEWTRYFDTFHHRLVLVLLLDLLAVLASALEIIEMWCARCLMRFVVLLVRLVVRMPIIVRCYRVL